MDTASSAYKQQQVSEGASTRLTRSSNYRSRGRGGTSLKSGCSSSKTGSSGTRGKSAKNTRGKDRLDSTRKKSASKTGTKRPLDVSNVDSECDKAAKGPGGMIIRLEDSKAPTLGAGMHQMEFVRDASAPFPILPTSDRIPCLILHDEITESSAGAVYYSELRAPLDEKVSSFIVKITDARMRSHQEYRNAFKELLTEYETYYSLGQFKHDNKFAGVIESTTPTCYGLYKARHWRRDLFALVIEFAGDVTLKHWKEWNLSDKSATLTSIICLHSIGVFHGDAAERNVALKHDDSGQVETAKFFDFDNSSWHECRGIEKCEELEDVRDSLFPDDDAPFDRRDFEEKTVRLYGLPCCNMKSRYADIPQMDREVIVQRLKKLSEMYDEEDR